MRSSLLVCAIAVLAAVACAEDVVILTSENFKEITESNDFVLVEFFAPWCGHCKKLAPEYEAAATILKEDGVVLGSVDATQEGELASSFGVKGYPTLKLFKHGKATDYQGGRTTDTIVSYIRKKTGPPAKTLANAEEVATFIESAKVTVVGYFAAESGADYDNFIAAAKADEDSAYGVCTDAEAAVADDVVAPAVVLHKTFDEKKNVFEGDITVEDLADFVASKSIPTVIPFTMEVVSEVFQSKIGKVAFLFSEGDNEAFTAVAKANQGKMVFSTTDGSIERLNSHVGVTKEDMPKLMILETSGQLKKYPLEADELTEETMNAHIAAYLSGDAKPFYKSEPVPEDNTGPVTVIVGKNFDEIVMDPTKDVLLEVYAPWCGHCKKLEPIYNELGEKFADNDNIVIAKMDGTGNEVDGVSVRGFPTIKFYPATADKPRAGEEYSGGRDFESFSTFLEENAKSSKAGADHDEL